MLDIPSISAIMAAVGVLIGVVFTMLQLRDLVKTRHSDLFMCLYSTWGSEDINKAHRKFLALKFKDYDDFVKKYGPIAGSEEAESSQIWCDIDRIGWFFNQMGFLVKEKLVHIKLVDELLGYWVIKVWETMKPLVYGWRKQYNMPESYQWFEYLYNEVRKRRSGRNA